MHEGWARMRWFGVIMEGEIRAEEERCSRHKHQEGACSMNGKERNPCGKNLRRRVVQSEHPLYARC